MSQLVIKTAKQELIGLSMDSGGWYLREGCITSAIAELKRE
jgi:hypothetical protein